MAALVNITPRLGGLQDANGVTTQSQWSQLKLEGTLYGTEEWQELPRAPDAQQLYDGPREEIDAGEEFLQDPDEHASQTGSVESKDEGGDTRMTSPRDLIARNYVAVDRSYPYARQAKRAADSLYRQAWRVGWRDAWRKTQTTIEEDVSRLVASNDEATSKLSTPFSIRHALQQIHDLTKMICAYLDLKELHPAEAKGQARNISLRAVGFMKMLHKQGVAWQSACPRPWLDQVLQHIIADVGADLDPEAAHVLQSYLDMHEQCEDDSQDLRAGDLEMRDGKSGISHLVGKSLHVVRSAVPATQSPALQEAPNIARGLSHDLSLQHVFSGHPQTSEKAAQGRLADGRQFPSDISSPSQPLQFGPFTRDFRCSNEISAKGESKFGMITAIQKMGTKSPTYRAIVNVGADDPVYVILPGSRFGRGSLAKALEVNSSLLMSRIDRAELEKVSAHEVAIIDCVIVESALVRSGMGARKPITFFQIKHVASSELRWVPGSALVAAGISTVDDVNRMRSNFVKERRDEHLPRLALARKMGVHPNTGQALTAADKVSFPWLFQKGLHEWEDGEPGPSVARPDRMPSPALLGRVDDAGRNDDRVGGVFNSRAAWGSQRTARAPRDLREPTVSDSLFVEDDAAE